MTIKQQGGIFGRNPSFNDVEANEITTETIKIDSLTNGRIVYTSSGQLTDNSGLTYATDRITMSYTGPSRIQLIDSVATNNFIVIANGSNSDIISANGWPINFKTASTTKLTVSNDGNITIPIGNLVIGASGKGIDFSATSGTGTSELFDDYEEGTWTPTLTTDGTDFSSVSYDARRGGSYTKIGRMVHIQMTMITDSLTVGSASGNVVIGGLPFPPTTTAGGGTDQGYAALSVANGSNWASNPPTAACVHETGSYIQLMVGATLTVIADANTSSNDNYVNICGTYITD